MSTAVRQERLVRNVARYGGGVAAPRPPVDRFTDHELTLLLEAARDEHFFPILLLTTPHGSADRGGLRAALARPQLGLGAAAADGGVAARPVG
jgi:hypothetical protein